MRLKLRFHSLSAFTAPKIAPNVILLLLIILSALSCRTSEKHYYNDEDLPTKISGIKRSKHCVYLSYQFPNYSGKIINWDKKVQYHIKARKLERRDARLALVGVSTKNYAILERIEAGSTIRIDSVSCNHGEFLFLKLPQPVQKGNYKIRAWGCRFGRHIDLVVD
jgi:hypothetical protein